MLDLRIRMATRTRKNSKTQRFVGYRKTERKARAVLKTLSFPDLQWTGSLSKSHWSYWDEYVSEEQLSRKYVELQLKLHFLQKKIGASLLAVKFHFCKVIQANARAARLLSLNETENKLLKDVCSVPASKKLILFWRLKVGY